MCAQLAAELDSIGRHLDTFSALRSKSEDEERALAQKAVMSGMLELRTELRTRGLSATWLRSLSDLTT